MYNIILMAYEEFVKPTGAEQYSLKVGKRIANTLTGFVAGAMAVLIAEAVAYYAYITFWGK